MREVTKDASQNDAITHQFLEENCVCVVKFGFLKRHYDSYHIIKSSDTEN